VQGAQHIANADCVKSIAARFLETADQKLLDVACVANIRRAPFVVKPDAGG
jgi:hypothetical protein